MKTVNARLLVVFLGFVMALSFVVVSYAGAEKPKKGGVLISEGKTVKAHYTLKVDGKVMESSVGKEPLQFKTGSHAMIPGFEKAVMGMKAGDKKSFKVSPQEGYGVENPKAVQTVPIKNLNLPANVKIEVGMTFYAQTSDGKKVPTKVKEIKKDMVVMDLNHPLAGKTLNFDIEIVEVK